MASTASCLQLHKRAERVAAALMGRLNTGDHVALVYPPGKRRFSPVLYCHSYTLTVPVFSFLCLSFNRNCKENIIAMCRNRPDCHLLWLPVRWLCASHSQTPAPPEPCDHSAHRQDDCWGNSASADPYQNVNLIPLSAKLLVSLVNVWIKKYNKLKYI